MFFSVGKCGVLTLHTRKYTHTSIDQIINSDKLPVHIIH